MYISVPFQAYTLGLLRAAPSTMSSRQVRKLRELRGEPEEAEEPEEEEELGAGPRPPCCYINDVRRCMFVGVFMYICIRIHM